MGASPTSSRLKLSGGEQARRHRAVCNRGHGLYSLYVEVPRIIARSTSVIDILVVIVTAILSGRNSTSPTTRTNIGSLLDRCARAINAPRALLQCTISEFMHTRNGSRVPASSPVTPQYRRSRLSLDLLRARRWREFEKIVGDWLV
jgi:hypothetical protein